MRINGEPILTTQPEIPSGKTSSKNSKRIATRSFLSYLWSGSFAIAAAILFYFYLKHYILSPNFFDSMHSLLGIYSATLGVILGFYFGRKSQSKRKGQGQLAIVVSLFWNLCVLLAFTVLATGRKIEDLISIWSWIGSYFSFIPTAIMSYYFSSEG